MAVGLASTFLPFSAVLDLILTNGHLFLANLAVPDSPVCSELQNSAVLSTFFFLEAHFSSKWLNYHQPVSPEPARTESTLLYILLGVFGHSGLTGDISLGPFQVKIQFGP